MFDPKEGNVYVTASTLSQKQLRCQQVYFQGKYCLFSFMLVVEDSQGKVTDEVFSVAAACGPP